ncbi:MAG: hypothetical protein JW787_06585 [Sedimentisphaerales bacterium]|nr:hypothetical protein [Sedimentisphaerales bacterium]
MIQSDYEICSDCGYKIPRSEQAYVFKGRIICRQCDRKLRDELIMQEEISDFTDHDMFSLAESCQEDSDTDANESSDIGASENSPASPEQPEIKLPSFIHSYYHEKKFSSVNSPSKKSLNLLHSRKMLFVVAGVVVFAVVLLIFFRP